jgi:two-component system chemotaxis response regulator CheB
MNNKIKLLIIDDSVLVRQTIKELLQDEVNIEIIGFASNPFNAAKLMAKGVVPDVIILDIEMPKMDGLTFLKKLMAQNPIPTIICSKLVEKNPEIAIKAIQYGAVEVLSKPAIGTKKFFYESKNKLINAIIAASETNITILNNIKRLIKVEPKLTADAIVSKNNFVSSNQNNQTNETIIAIGASTGGTQAIEFLLRQFPENSPGMVIVQHMPVQFTESFAKRIDNVSKLHVKEAKDGDKIERGIVLIAPGDKHLLIKRVRNEYFVELKDGPLVRRHKPSVDVLFRTVAQNAGENAIGILLTGMGDDGAYGLLEMKENGGYTIAEDESTCVVFGMPKEAIKLGAAYKILPLDKIVEDVLKYLKKKEIN